MPATDASQTLVDRLLASEPRDVANVLLESFRREYLGPTNGNYALAVHVHSEGGSGILCEGSYGVSGDHFRQLLDSTSGMSASSFRWKPRSADFGLSSSVREQWPFGLAQEVLVPVPPRIQGRLFVLGRRDLPPGITVAASAAASALSFVLFSQTWRTELYQQTALLRHEFLGPVQGLVSAARMIAKLAENPPADRDRLKHAVIQIDQEAELISQLRQASRFSVITLAGQSPHLRLGDHDVGEVVSQIARRYSALLSRRGITLVVEQPESPTPAYFDPEALDYVLAEIMTNVMKYAYRNTDAVLTLLADSSSVRITVSNVGVGLDPSTSEYIFHRGFRGEVALAAGFKGEGLGLYVARRLLEELGGSIEIGSEPVDLSAASDATKHLVRVGISVPRSRQVQL